MEAFGTVGEGNEAVQRVPGRLTNRSFGTGEGDTLASVSDVEEMDRFDAVQPGDRLRCPEVRATQSADANAGEEPCSIGAARDCGDGR